MRARQSLSVDSEQFIIMWTQRALRGQTATSWLLELCCILIALWHGKATPHPAAPCQLRHHSVA